MAELTGRCLCGGVHYTVSGPVWGESVCHCGQCRRQPGHLWASAVVDRRDITITGDTLTWYGTSDIAERGFCSRCGTSLFWSAHGEASMSFSLGALDTPKGLRLTKHIWVQDKGDYYDITDDLPQKPK